MPQNRERVGLKLITKKAPERQKTRLKFGKLRTAPGNTRNTKKAHRKNGYE